MQLIIISLLSLAAGGAIGYFYQRIRSQQLVIDKQLLAQQLEQVKAQQKSWDELHQETIKSAKAAMFETSRDLSKELLEKHKLESKEAKEQAEQITKKETENLHKEFKTVVEQLAAMQGKNQLSEKKLAAIWQSLTSPVKASNFAEIGLENTLKNFGLEAGVDFTMQASLNYDGQRLRPDAIINLPAGNLIIIDAKTSKYFLEMAAEEADAELLKQKLKASMNTHLQQLAAREYATAGRSKAEGSYVVNVMYLNNESYYGKILECDADFDRKCRETGVMLVTPSSMNMLLNIATHQIAREKQERNFVAIKQQMGRVVSSVDVLLRDMEKVGKAIHDTAKKYSELSKPGNRLIGRIKQVEAMGLEPENPLKLPKSLPNFNVIENEVAIVEVEAETIDNLRTLEKKAG